MLTEAGWPRPIVDGWPIPWVSPSESLSDMNKARAAAAASGAICAVCGKDHADGGEAFALVKAADVLADLAAVDVQPMDNGVMHRACLLLALSKCPALKRLIEADELRIVRVPVNAARVVVKRGSPKARFDGADCELIDRAAL